MNENPLSLVPFTIEKCPTCQSRTNDSFWYGTTTIYPVTYAIQYEPYFGVRMTAAVPPFWEHFTGFARDKVTWVEGMALAGFQFHVSPDMFPIHINHDYSKQEKRLIRTFKMKHYSHEEDHKTFMDALVRPGIRNRGC